MKKEFKKWLKVVLLVLLLTPFIVNADTYNSQEQPMLVFVGMELFVTIHMSVFVLMPIAEIINSGKKWKIFGILTVIRIIILLIGNLTIGFIMAITDFIMVFIGAFILVPLAYAIKRQIYKGNLGFHEYVELDEGTLISFGLKDVNLLKNKLFAIFCSVQDAVSNEDRRALKELCQASLYEKFISSLDLYVSNNQRNYVVDIENVRNKLVELKNSGDMLQATLIQEVKLLDYTEDATGQVIDGSKTKKQTIMYKLVFNKKVKNKNKGQRKCPNCGAMLGDSDVCSYCNSEFVERRDWVLETKDVIRMG